MIFQPTYFSPIYQFQKLVNVDKVLFETQDNYQKQSYRTRLKIYTPNGLQSLVIPIKHKSGVRLLTKEVEIEYAYDWQRKHLKSLQNSYRSSPYFEFYEDDLTPLFENKEKYLLDFLFKTQELSFEMLQLDIDFTKTVEYLLDYPSDQDFRFLENPKYKEKFPVNRYTQVFEAKHGYLPNLSILDLLFNEGPNAINLLQD